MESQYRLHALLPAGGSVQIWAERVAGRQVVVSADEIRSGDLPADLLSILRSRPLRHRSDVFLSTPSGKLKKLPVPTAAWTPDQSLKLIEKLRVFVKNNSDNKQIRSTNVAQITEMGVGKEVIFLLDLFDFVVETVRAGRIMLRMERVEGDWVPRWTLATSGDHHKVLDEFRAKLPGIFAHNGTGDVVGDAADDWAHWIAVSLIKDRAHPPEYEELNSPLVNALLDSVPLSKASPATVTALNDWRNSAREAATQLVLRLSAPEDVVDDEDLFWRLELALSINDAPLTPIVANDADEATVRRLRRRLKEAVRIWPGLDDHLQNIRSWEATGVWRPGVDIVTGDHSRDRVLAIGLPLEAVEELLSSKAMELRNAGFPIMIPRGWAPAKPQVKNVLKPVGQGPGSGKIGLDQLLDFSWDAAIGGQRLSSTNQQELFDQARQIVEINGQYVFVDPAALARARDWLKAVKEAAGVDEAEQLETVTLADIMEADAQASPADRDGEHEFRVEADGWVGQLLGGDHEVAPIDNLDMPPTVTATLRDHQQRGVNWLGWMAAHGLGCILADDMGLGKTLQILALIAWEKANDQRSGPTLVIAPTSVLSAWQNESARHIQGLQVVVDHGSGKVADDLFEETALAADLVVTSYGTVARNPERYQSLRWGRVVADEAQNIKNPSTKQSRAVRGIPAGHHIALTGTPVENRLSDLFAIMDFANPGILGTAAAFQNRLAIPIERYDDDGARARLSRLVDPFILRRLKTDPAVGGNLPVKREHVELVPLSAEQAALYEEYIASLEQALAERTKDRRGVILGSLVKIKQICNHPAHFAGDGSGILDHGRHRSPKIKRVFEIIAQAVESNQKVLLFTQFPSFGRMLIPALEEEFNQRVSILDGSLTRKQRTDLVNEFQRPGGPNIMILSVRAGGTGITLTQASVVVHIDRWWNPAVEDQATDRAYRIGQEKDVDVYKLISKGTLDERIHDVITGKRQLAGSVISAGEGWIAGLEDEDLAELWRLRTASEEAGRASPGADEAPTEERT